jgi:hypothetical protein
MIVLSNPWLSVSILDPVDDAAKLGTRYCSGGSIFQVEDPARGVLLSGPTYPTSYNLADGQGLPEAFQPHLPLEPGHRTGAKLLAIGIGLVDPAANAIVERCAWQTERDETTLRLRAVQAADQWRFTIERRVSLRGRTLRSETVIENAGRHLPFQWYPHPFFPHHPSGECCRFNVPIVLPENPGYELAENGFLRMKNFPWKGVDHFQIVGQPGDRPIQVVQRHPVTGLVVAACDYPASRLPVWGNENTFSFEPYYERVVQPKEQARWSITYDF